MFVLLIKASLVVIVLLAFYKIFLEKESFFALNRMYLLGCLFAAFALPFLSLPQLVNQQGIVSTWMEKSNIKTISISSETASETSSAATIKEVVSSDEIQKTDKATPSKTEIIASKPTIEETTQIAVASSSGKGIGFWLLAIYLFGVIVLSINLIAQIFSTMLKVFKNKDQIEDGEGTIVNMTSEIEPCSFFKYIFINPASYEYETYEQILAHEKIHVKQMHSIDLLLSELAVIALWFNPFIWKLRTEVEKNIEYQTDDLLVNNEPEEKEEYQLNLVKIATYTKPLTITTNYNQSLIKQRILKMNTKKSNPYSYWKYTFIFPLVFTMLLFLNKPLEAFTQSESTPLTNNENTEQPIILDNKNNTEPNKKIENKLIEKEIPSSTSNPETTISFTTPEANKPPEVDSKTNTVSDCKTLLQAVRANDIAKVKTLLKSYDPNCIDQNPGHEELVEGANTYRRLRAKTPLVAAARKGYLDIAKILVEEGAKTNFHDRNNETPLMAAANKGNLDFVKYLMDKGAKVNTNSQGFGTALSAASSEGHTEIVKYLMGKGAKVNFQNDGSGSALVSAAGNGKLETVKYLLSQGANINASTNGQGSALVRAAGNGEIEVVKYLLSQGANVNDGTNGQGTALDRAVSNGELEVVEYLISQGADINGTSNGQGSALVRAAGNGELETVKYLLNQNADINIATNAHGSALCRAAGNGELEVVKYLLDQGADINADTDGQGSALSAAAGNGELEVVKYLLSQGADINAANNGQGSALSRAAGNGEKEVVKYLLSQNADIDRMTNGQGSALIKAVKKAEIDLVKYLVAQGADVNAMIPGQGSALIQATKREEYEIIKFLLKHKADPWLSPPGHDSPIVIARKMGSKQLFEIYKDY